MSLCKLRSGRLFEHHGASAAVSPVALASADQDAHHELIVLFSSAIGFHGLRFVNVDYKALVCFRDLDAFFSQFTNPLFCHSSGVRFLAFVAQTPHPALIGRSMVEEPLFAIDTLRVLFQMHPLVNQLIKRYTMKCNALSAGCQIPSPGGMGRKRYSPFLPYAKGFE